MEKPLATSSVVSFSLEFKSICRYAHNSIGFIIYLVLTYAKKFKKICQLRVSKWTLWQIKYCFKTASIYLQQFKYQLSYDIAYAYELKFFLKSYHHAVFKRILKSFNSWDIFYDYNYRIWPTFRHVICIKILHCFSWSYKKGGGTKFAN